MEIKFKKVHPNAKLPSQGKPGDAAFDLYCVENISIPVSSTIAISTGLVLADMPDNFNSSSIFLQIVGRSGLALKGIFPIGGIIDSTYRGEIKVIVYNGNSRMDPFKFNAGDRIAQLLIQQIVNHPNDIQMVESHEITETIRGSGGFGSTGA